MTVTAKTCGPLVPTKSGYYSKIMLRHENYPWNVFCGKDFFDRFFSLGTLETSRKYRYWIILSDSDNGKPRDEFLELVIYNRGKGPYAAWQAYPVPVNSKKEGAVPLKFGHGMFSFLDQFFTLIRGRNAAYCSYLPFSVYLSVDKQAIPVKAKK